MSRVRAPGGARKGTGFWDIEPGGWFFFLCLRLPDRKKGCLVSPGKKDGIQAVDLRAQHLQLCSHATVNFSDCIVGMSQEDPKEFQVAAADQKAGEYMT